MEAAAASRLTALYPALASLDAGERGEVLARERIDVLDSAALRAMAGGAPWPPAG